LYCIAVWQHIRPRKGDGDARSLYCWGYNGLRTGVKSVIAGEFNTCAIDESDALRCWGKNEYGETDVPTILDGVGIKFVTTTYHHACAIDASDALYCWEER
jgi:hypothetical protein